MAAEVRDTSWAGSYDGSWPEPMSTVAVNGVTLAYTERGEGEPVVFVHGGISDLRTWVYQLSEIGSRYRAISYSRRYARPNEDIAAGADDQMLPHVEDLVAFLDSIDASPAHLVGNSWGAFICLETAIRYPESVRSLVLCEPPVLPLFMGTPPKPGEIARMFIRSPRTTRILMGFGARTMGPAQKAFRRGDDARALEIFVRGVLGPESGAAIPEVRKQQMRENLPAQRAGLIGAGFPPLTDAEVRSVTVPTLLAEGDRSPAFLGVLTDRLSALLPHAERVTIPDASHAMHEENPAAFNEAIGSFIGRD